MTCFFYFCFTSAPLSPLKDTLVSTLAAVVVVNSCPPVEVGGAAPPTTPPLSLAAGTPPLNKDKSQLV